MSSGVTLHAVCGDRYRLERKEYGAREKEDGEEDGMVCDFLRETAVCGILFIMMSKLSAYASAGAYLETPIL